MKKRSAPVYWMVVLICCGLAASCARQLQETRISAPDARLNFIIAGDASEFKDSIRSRLIDRYKPYCTIEVVNINKLKEIDPDAYDAVLIMDTCMADTRFNPSFKAFVDKLEDQDKVVLFLTAADPDWEFSYGDIDAITSASVMENEEMVVSRITEKIDAIIAKKK